MSQTTCGPLYQAGLESFTGMDENKIPLFAAGFVSGQAEKIHLGACSAAMFRPSERWLPTVLAIVNEVAARYDLTVQTLPTSRGVEVWLTEPTPQIVAAVSTLRGMVENSPRWHKRRGVLCGIPAHMIDPQFHRRSGYGEPCDLPGAG